ncbi:MAG: WecB/TagA/CpsF family glycosyltransferase [Actinomycetota bacterium]
MAGRKVIDLGRRNVIGVRVNAIDYEAAADHIIRSANDRTPFTLTAAASHAVMTAWNDPEQRHRLNALDAVVPDGQPVRHALRVLHGIHLPDRVYGPNLMLRVCGLASEQGFSVFLYGSTKDVLTPLVANLNEQFPALAIAGAEPSRFRTMTVEERDDLAERIRSSGARIVFVGLGCPRQEIWAYEMRERLSMPILAVGAAFDFHAGTLAQAPGWMQDNALEWLYRLGREPQRLWRRYLGLGPRFIGLVLAQKAGRRFEEEGRVPSDDVRVG